MHMHVRLGFFYFAYLAVLGAFSPFFGPFLATRGVSDADIGLIMTFWYGTRIFAPILWDRAVQGAHQPLRWTQWACLAICGSAMLFQPESSVPIIMLVMLLFASLYNAILPQFEAHTLHVLQDQPGAYSRIRMYGSIGFLLVVLGFGALFRNIGSAYLIWAMLPLLLLMLLAAMLQAPMISVRSTQGIASAGFFARCRALPVLAWSVLLIAWLNQIAHGPFYVYFSLYLKRAGLSELSIGAFWAVGVLAEIAMFLLLSSAYLQGLRRWLAPNVLLPLALLMGALRWLLVALFPNDAWILGASQLFHAFTFAAAHSAIMQLLFDALPHDLGFAQGLLYGLSSGVGGVVGAALAAFMWDGISPPAAFALSAVISLLACACCVLLRKKSQPLLAE
jgi:MFS transporter, PPP family, 3-phenylpropionic acid transporter